MRFSPIWVVLKASPPDDLFFGRTTTSLLKCDWFNKAGEKYLCHRVHLSYAGLYRKYFHTRGVFVQIIFLRQRRQIFVYAGRGCGRISAADGFQHLQA